MIDLRVTKKRLSNHFRYSLKKYIVFTFVAIMALYMLFIVTKPKVPPDKKIDIVIIGYGNDVGIRHMEEDILAILPEDQQEVNITYIYQAGSDDYQFIQLLWAKLAAGEGDVYIFPTEGYLPLFEQTFMDLTPAIEEGCFKLPEGVDPYLYYNDGITDPNNEYELETDEGTYALPLDNLPGLAEITELTTTGDNGETLDIKLGIGITGFSENTENALKAIEWILEDKAVFHEEKAVDENAPY